MLKKKNTPKQKPHTNGPTAKKWIVKKNSFVNNIFDIDFLFLHSLQSDMQQNTPNQNDKLP